jgi:hypothetical protein
MALSYFALADGGVASWYGWGNTSAPGRILIKLSAMTCSPAFKPLKITHD